MIKNNPVPHSEHIEDMRGAIEHRAAWFYYLVDEARKRGLDDSFAHDAIMRCGCFHGANKYTQTNDLTKFAPEFANQNVIDIFDMEIVKSDEQDLSIDFHYCPLVASWLKAGAKEEELPALCQIAMDGDRGIIHEFDAFKFELGETIAEGKDVCQIRISKK